MADNKDLSFLGKVKYISHTYLKGKRFDEVVHILLPKLFWSTVRKNCSSYREKLLKFKAEGREFANILRSLEQFVRTVKSQNNLW